MFSTLGKKNEYHGFTHEVKLDTIYRLKLIEMNSTTINVQLVEKRIIRADKIHFAFLVNGSLFEAVMNGFEEIQFPIRHKPQIQFNMDRIEQIQDRVFDILRESKEYIAKYSILRDIMPETK